MRLIPIILAITFFALPALGEETKKKSERISLWNGKNPESKAVITVHHPAKPNGAAIVICPGGGYGGLVTGAEGHGIARWLNQYGIMGVVLEYTLPKGRSHVPLHDAQRAIRMVRVYAKVWKNINPNRIGIIGFSAGGHLAATAGTQFEAGKPDATDIINRVSCRPDFMILVYPVITMGPKTNPGSKQRLLGKNPSVKLVKLFSNELQVTKKTPPTYLAHAKDDKVVTPDNSRMFHAACKKNNVASKYLELPRGGHGLNRYQGPMWDAWKIGSLRWLASLKMIPLSALKK